MNDSGRVLVLRHHEEDHPGLIGEALVARGFALDVVMMNETTPTPSLEGVDVLLILGSSSAVYDHEVEKAWFGRELGLIAEAGAPRCWWTSSCATAAWATDSGREARVTRLDG